MTFSQSYVGRLRSIVGARLLLVPGARVIIEREDGSILLQHRSDFHLWGLPGGIAEEGESVEETIVREVREETGLVLNRIEPFAYASNPKYETVTFPNGDKCQFHVMNFWTRDYLGDPKGSTEGMVLQWFQLAELPKMLENMRRSVDALLRFRATNCFQLL